MRYTGIAQVSELLVMLLRSHLVPDAIRNAGQIGLCEPQETGDFTVGVWLYDIQECMQLNRHEMVTIDSKRQKFPSLYVNLYYMITARSAGDVRYRAKEEALMLGKIIQLMKDAAVLDLSGLEDADGGEPVCQIVLQNLTMEEKQRIYHVPDGCYKTSLFYEIGPIEISSMKERNVQRVTELSYKIDEKEQRTLGDVLAVLPIDAFMGKPVAARDFMVEVAGVRPSARKEDGYFVFSGVPLICGAEKSGTSDGEDEIRIRLKGSGYQEKVLHVPAASIPLKNPVITVRMDTDAFYPYPPHTVCVKGTLSTKCCLRAAFLQRESALRLAEDYQKDDGTITIYQEGETDLTGSLFYMEKERTMSGEEVLPDAEQNGASGSFVLLGEAESRSKGRYRLVRPLKDDFGRSETRLYPARMQTAAERETHYFFAFHGAGDEQEGDIRDGETIRTGADILCRTETAEGVEEYRFFVESGGMRVMDF